MEVRLEDNPVISRIWKEWLEKDKELSGISKEDRISECKDYQWLYPKTKKVVDLEALYSSVHQRSNREEFHKWFYVVCNHLLSKVHLGENSYYRYKVNFRKLFNKEKCTSHEFSQMVLLVLAMLDYVTGLRGGYCFIEGSDKSYGYPYDINKEKLIHWDCDSFYGTATISGYAVPEYVVSKTSVVSFQEYGKDKNRISWTQHPDWLSERQYQTISSIEVEEEGIRNSSNWLFDYSKYQFYYCLSGEEQENLMKDWISYQKLRDLSCHIIGGCLDDSDKPDGKGYAGRFYHPLTNMRAEHRHRYLRLEGEKIVEVDVSSAQPTFLGLYQYQKTGVVSEWLRHCLAGDFYEWIRERTGAGEERATIKKWMMQYLYSCFQPNLKKDYKKEHKPTYEWKETNDPFLSFQQRLNRFLKEKEPAIYSKIEWHKRHPEYRDDKDNIRCYMDENGQKRKKIGQGKWCSTLSYDLVKMEVEYIKDCIRALPKDLPFYTIHDCICVPESRSMEVQAIMEDVSRRKYGLTIQLKRENTSERGGGYAGGSDIQSLS